jgi:hypothetical protein
LPGAGFSKARFVSRNAGEAQLAVGPGRQAILATARGAGVDVSIKSPGADSMPAAQRLDHAQGFATGVAAGGERQVALAWMASSRLRGRAQVRVYAGATTGRSPRRIGTLGHDATGEDVGVEVDARGATVVSWEENLEAERGDPTARSHLGIAYRAAGARFSDVSYLGPVSLDDSPQSVRIGTEGRAYVLYEAFQSPDAGSAGYRRVYATERRP